MTEPLPDAMTLVALAYTSSATHRLGDAELERLLEQARRTNEELGVTGVLLYHDGSFLQYFEGPAEGVEKVYERIRRSTLHGGIIELIRGPVPKRAFSGWLMGFTRAPGSTLLQLSNASWKARMRQGGAGESMAGSEGFELLLQFWNSNRAVRGG